jgi:biotin operon repressor
MPLRSTFSKILLTLFGIAIVLIVIDVLFFQSQNITAFFTAVSNAFLLNPIVSWGTVILLVSLLTFISFVLFYRRRIFIQNLKHELEETDRITLIDLAQKLDETPTKIEVEINRMTTSKVSRLHGLLIISQGKHVYLGEKLLNEITELHNDEQSRGEIANSLQISRDEVDKAVDFLIEKDVIEEREEKITRKVRPSYRRGTR